MSIVNPGCLSVQAKEQRWSATMVSAAVVMAPVPMMVVEMALIVPRIAIVFSMTIEVRMAAAAEMTIAITVAVAVTIAVMWWPVVMSRVRSVMVAVLMNNWPSVAERKILGDRSLLPLIGPLITLGSGALGQVDQWIP